VQLEKSDLLVLLVLPARVKLELPEKPALLVQLAQQEKPVLQVRPARAKLALPAQSEKPALLVQQVQRVQLEKPVLPVRLVRVKLALRARLYNDNGFSSSKKIKRNLYLFIGFSNFVQKSKSFCCFL
jgi:hypothetical protein